MKKKLAIVFLTYNSELTIRKSLIKALKLSNNIYVVDSYSDDKTEQICKKFKCKLIKRKFKNYSNQRNWIIKKLNKKFLWQLHLDADEVIDKNSIYEINKIIRKNDLTKKTFLIKRKYYFLNKKLNFPGLNKWHLRLFRSGSTKCENTLYDQHFITSHKVYKINGFIHDNDMLDLVKWKIKHRKWADLEAKSYLKKKYFSNNFSINDDPRFFYRLIKITYYKLPKYIRPILYFFFRYFIKGGFLDGKNGFLFSYYQCLWFRMLIDIKISQKKHI